jgi:hypothetical protein
LQLGQVGIHALRQHFAHDAAVFVVLVICHRHGLVQHGLCQVVSGLGPKGLAFFGCIDARQADGVLLALCIEHDQGVAIGHADHLALQLCGQADCAASRQQKTQQAAPDRFRGAVWLL